MKYGFIDVEKATHSVVALCRVLAVSTSGSYAWRHRVPSSRSKRDHVLATHIRVIHKASRGTCGVPRVHAQLRREVFAVGGKRVARIMGCEGPQGARRRRFKATTEFGHGRAVAPNHVLRLFESYEPDRIWVANITYVRTWEGWLYLAVVLDLFSRRVVGWAADGHMRTELPPEALQMAFTRRAAGPHLIHQSNRGSQYTADHYVAELTRHKAIPIMSERGDCWDNAVAESFLGSLKAELIHPVAWPTKNQAPDVVREYIDFFYNNQRLR